MKIPAKLLKQVAGPLLASTALSCSSPPSEPIVPITEVGANEAHTAPAPDPVAYDPAAEADRLVRTEALLAARDEAREVRVDAHEDALRERRARRARQAQLRIMRRHTYIACGRG